jgi:TRAP-type C4-dicarboxylate transport system permease large subunit
MLRACSFTVGGILERTGGSFSFPDGFDSPLLAMLVIVVFLIFIGMIMDPFGALILVSGIIAPVAYQQGIEPIHFWMTCLVAFELGYLTPPVSLNHLLTKQVVGSHEVELALQEGHNFYYRHERILLPLLVMSTTLLIVAFGPLLVSKN